MAANAAEYLTPEYARAEYRPKSMVLIPPHADASLQKTISAEQMIEAASILEDAASVVLKQQLGKLGYEVRVLTVDEVNANPNLQLMVRNLNERYDTDLTQIQRRPKDIRSRRFNIGDEARVLAAQLDADALIVSRIQASGTSGALTALSLGGNGYAQMSIAIIAGDNGDLEAFFTHIDPGLSAKKIEEQPLQTMADVTMKVLKDYPSISGTTNVRKSWPQSTGRKAPENAISDADVLSDLEALFEMPPADAAAAPDAAPPLEE